MSSSAPATSVHDAGSRPGPGTSHGSPARGRPLASVPPHWDDVITVGYVNHAASMRAAARRIVGSARADEVVQDVFTTLYAHPERFDATRGGLRPYLLLQVRSRAIDRIRTDGARRQRELAQRPVQDRTQPGPAAGLVRDEMLDALRQLPWDERAAIVLAYYGGLTYREVAEHLDQAEGTVKSRIRRGLARLRTHPAIAG